MYSLGLVADQIGPEQKLRGSVAASAQLDHTSVRQRVGHFFRLRRLFLDRIRRQITRSLQLKNRIIYINGKNIEIKNQK